MTKKTKHEEITVGIDVSKDKLDVAFLDKNTQVGNDPAGYAKLLKILKKLPQRPRVIVLEATGGYEEDVALAMHDGGFPIAVVNPRNVREFARASGRLAKTDAIDARVLATFGRVMEVQPKDPPSADQRALRAFMDRRGQLKQMLIAERHRLKRESNKVVRASLEATIEALDNQLKALEATIAKLIESKPEWSRLEKLLRSAPGVGAITAWTLLAHLPELGSMEPRSLAMLAGVAPLNCDSGTFKGKRRVWGGRAPIRGALYMAALTASLYNPALRRFRERLLAKGKPKKLVLMACMRKLLVLLNAMVRTGKEWDPAQAA
jgi:transposase